MTKKQLQTLLSGLKAAGLCKFKSNASQADMAALYQQHCKEVSERKLTRFLRFTDLSVGKHDGMTWSELTTRMEPEEVNYAIAWGMLKAKKTEDGEIDLTWVRPCDRPMYFHLWNS
jgi:hypothetical protein